MTIPHKSTIMRTPGRTRVWSSVTLAKNTNTMPRVLQEKAGWWGKPHIHTWRGHSNIGREDTQTYWCSTKRSLGEPSHKRRSPSEDQHVVPRQGSTQSHDQRSSKILGAWWEAHWKLEVWWKINCTNSRQRIHLVLVQERCPTSTNKGILYPKLEE